jgi:hypothetical protein
MRISALVLLVSSRMHAQWAKEAISRSLAHAFSRRGSGASIYKELLFSLVRALGGGRARFELRLPFGKWKSGIAMVQPWPTSKYRRFPAEPLASKLSPAAGGLELRNLLTTLPAESGMAFILIQHLDSTDRSMMVKLLSPQARCQGGYTV